MNFGALTNCILVILFSFLLLSQYTLAFTCSSTSAGNIITFTQNINQASEKPFIVKRMDPKLQGDFSLVSSADVNVQIRVKSYKKLNYQVGNAAVAVEMKGNRLEHHGNYYIINGKRNGSVKDLRNGVTGIHDGHRIVLEMQTETSPARVEIHAFKTKVSPPFHIAVYTNLPPAYMNKVEGLCGPYSGDAKDDLGGETQTIAGQEKYYLHPSTTKALFSHVFVPSKNHAVELVSAAKPDKELMKKAAEACAERLEKKERDPLFNDCVMDIIVTGNVETGLILTQSPIETEMIEDLGSYNKNGTYYGVYLLLKRLYQNLMLERVRISKILIDTQKQIKQKEILLAHLKQKLNSEIHAMNQEQQAAHLAEINKVSAQQLAKTHIKPLRSELANIRKQLRLIRDLLRKVALFHKNKEHHGAALRLEGDGAATLSFLTDLKKYETFIYGSSGVIQMMEESAVAQSADVENIIEPAVVEDVVVPIDLKPVVVESAAVVLESEPVVVETAAVVLESDPVVVESAAVVLEDTAVVLENIAGPAVVEEAKIDL